MKNPEYFRLFKNGRFVGFKRIVTEFLPAGHSLWQHAELEHDEAQILSRPAIGIENLKRESFSKIKAALVKTCKDANESRTD